MIPKYATHIPVLVDIFKKHNIKDVLEFGCGYASTALFNMMECYVTSVEMQNKGWYEKIHNAFPNVDMRLSLGPDAWAMDDYKDRYDLILIDGHKDSRPECANWAQHKTDIIVIHDFEERSYGWERLDINGFDYELFSDLCPWTRVYKRIK